MKRILLCFFIVFCITSCTLKEKMVMNEDGSGTFSYGFDMSPMYKLGMQKSDSTKVNKVVDTTFTFKDVLAKIKDSLSKLPNADKEKIAMLEKEKEKLKILENFKVSIKVNDEKKQFEYSMAFDFPSGTDFKSIATPAESLEALAAADKKRLGALSAAPKPEEKSNTTIFYDGKVFIKSVTPSKDDKKTKKKKEVKKEKSDDPFSKKMEEMLKECKYIAEYQFPKKIKTVSIKNAVIASDRKSFTVEIPLDNMQESSVDFGFKVEFEQ
ncbi:hypothetical protein LPB248_06135 [Flavobacterium sp. LPB0248]|uniref:hypothetical protein n=1 Tax=Flavobacterium sp. LPB0248 TaxID=2614441 RepID=UPI0015A563A6|nr:hypothetical protein [Flavobacterium sp. LPB0248]QLC65876.1 hypothetical protein LPB248_06135 [Flavobacterium sp. LPB0248]